MTRDDLDRLAELEPHHLTQAELTELIDLARGGLLRRRDRWATYEASLPPGTLSLTPFAPLS